MPMSRMDERKKSNEQGSHYSKDELRSFKQSSSEKYQERTKEKNDNTQYLMNKGQQRRK